MEEKREAPKGWEHDSFTYELIGKAMAVHRELGPGLDEIFYHQRLSEMLRQAGIEHLFKPRGRLMHRGFEADVFEPDLVFPGDAVLELKCLAGDFERNDFAQLYGYLKCWKLSVGLLMDFAKQSLFHRRVPFTEVAFDLPDPTTWVAAANLAGQAREVALTVCRGIVRVATEHGLGFRDTTYRGLLVADFKAEGIPHVVTPPATVRWDGHAVGETHSDCLVLDNQCVLRVLAFHDDITAADRAITQTYLRLFDLPFGLIVNFGRASVQIRWATPPRTR